MLNMSSQPCLTWEHPEPHSHMGSLDLNSFFKIYIPFPKMIMARDFKKKLVEVIRVMKMSTSLVLATLGMGWMRGMQI